MVLLNSVSHFRCSIIDRRLPITPSGRRGNTAIATRHRIQFGQLAFEMARKPKKSPPRVYHDGLIPTTTDTYQSYPEVVPDDHDQVKHEKSYPELAQPPEPRASSPPTSSVTTANTPPIALHGARAQHHHHHQQQQPSDPSPLAAPPPPPLIHPLPVLPRTSGVHSLRQAWSEVDESEDGVAGARGGSRLPLWKRPVFWVAAVALVVVAVLAGVLGAVVSGRIISQVSSSDSNSQQRSPSSVTDPSCPGANNLNYTSVGSTPRKTFRIQCGANYPNGDGALGLLNDTDVHHLATCLDACARHAECVGAVFVPGTTTAGQCWLKEFIGAVRTGGDVEGMVSGVLWQ
ncbi:hypothetical protein N657DRAFT_650890 [Parathielavia appendiculata]|uniref:Apple domain-containing protein n=1 Tax=Parathielavia appendiculata TaxID=2587402 RepID=A0AAN6TQL7_9PEZI|nr:hypothetical protein N657DRAFT_650890 [Parathielavia appendiculata]